MAHVAGQPLIEVAKEQHRVDAGKNVQAPDPLICKQGVTSSNLVAGTILSRGFAVFR